MVNVWGAPIDISTQHVHKQDHLHTCMDTQMHAILHRSTRVCLLYVASVSFQGGLITCSHTFSCLYTGIYTFAQKSPRPLFLTLDRLNASRGWNICAGQAFSLFLFGFRYRLHQPVSATCNTVTLLHVLHLLSNSFISINWQSKPLQKQPAEPEMIP